MKLSHKLLFSFLFAALLVGVVGYVSHSLNSGIQKRVVKVTDRAIFNMEYAGEMGLALHKSLMATQEYMKALYRAKVNPDEAGKALGAARKARADAANQLTRFRHYMDLIRKEKPASFDTTGRKAESDSLGEVGSWQAKLYDRFENYESLTLKLFDLAQENYADGEELLNVTIEPYFKNNLIPILERVRVSSHQQLNAETQTLQQELAYSESLIILVTLLVVALALGVGYLIYRSIARPLHKLTDAARNLGQGNLNERIRLQSNDEIGELASAFNDMASNLSKTTVSKDYVDNIIQSMADSLIVTDQFAHIEKVNRATERLLGFEANELIGKPLKEIFHNGDGRKAVRMTEDESENEVLNFETHYETKSGQLIPVSFSRSVLHDASGHIKGLVCLASDITERKEAEEQITRSLKEKEVLLTEIHHRVKNNLAVISSLLQMQIYNTENEVASSILRDSQLRIQSIALIHEKLYQSEELAFIDFDKYVGQLLTAITDTFSDQKHEVEIETNLQPASLNVNQAIPCSLWFNEIIVNAYKHAFVGRGRGKIKVKMEEQGEKLMLRISDDGVGMPSDFNIENASSLGMTLIHTLTKQLDGELEIDTEGGTTFTLRFPVN